MDRIRSSFNSMMRSERYSRFTLQPVENGERHVEVKLSDDPIDDSTEVEASGSPSFRPAPPQAWSRRAVVYVVFGTLLMFIIGFLVGHISHQKPKVESDCGPSNKSQTNGTDSTKNASPAPPAALPDVPLTWGDVTHLLTGKLTSQAFENTLKVFDRPRRSAGSEEDASLGNGIFDAFKKLEMEPWTDIHYVQLQKPDSNRSNVIEFDSEVFKPEGYLAYSGTGRVQGRLVYGNYGRQEDLTLVQQSVDLKGSVLLLRAGKISFAQQVDNAAKKGAIAVLIYADPQDYNHVTTTELYGHVHLGSGDPYTPGFPSFNHTQFPPVESSGLPKILAQTITSGMATRILSKLGGQSLPEGWEGFYNLGNENDTISVEVNNFLTEKKINNVFGVIKGFVDADRYVVIGAQRDAWGPGFAASTVGTSVLVELARSISDMVENDGFKPRRSIVFASWSAGEYGSVGATEWLEGYLSSLGMKAFSYINLDGIVTGQNGFKVAASPLMHTLVEKALNEVNNKDKSLSSQFAKSDWESNILEPMQMDNAAYPFLAFSGIPSMSFRFTSGSSSYRYFGTLLDTQEKLNTATSSQVPQLAETAGRFAGSIALRLVHDHLLQLNLMKYDKVIRSNVAKINAKIKGVQRMQPQMLPKALTVQWLISASGSYSRASRSLETDIQNSNLDDIEMCRIINDRIMTVERNFLSPYISPREIPFRHILFGTGSYTLQALSKHLEALKTDNPDADANLFRHQFALATWTLQGCANSLAGDIWSLDNEI
uniref:Transferrin receptor protein 1 n=1 Tax=Iconisemion striatum TaxID=60296 RepID=A0A1A7WVF2_9TELE